MKINSRVFGEIDIADDKIVVFEKGLMGFEEYTKYTILFDSEKPDNKGIMWLQSLDEESLAFPVMDPTCVKPDYNPLVEEEWLAPIGNVDNDDSLYVLVILTVPSDITKVTANFKAPLVINTETMKGCQTIADNEEYEVRYNIHEYIESLKKEGC